MRKIIYSLFAIALFFGACQEDRFEDYFGDEGAVDKQASLMETLASMPDYSTFYSLLKETGLDSLFMRNQIMTIWAPSNDSVPENLSSMSMKDKRSLVLNHINLTAINHSIFNSVSQFEALTGKFLRVNKTFSTLSGKQVTKFDVLCRDGILNTLSAWLVPQYNVYDYLDNLSDEYSIFRDTILSYNDTIFHPEMSEQIGYNQYGQPVFDSVFVIENEYAKEMDLSSESARYTLFVPSNAVLNKMYDQTTKYFKGIGYECDDKDSLYWFSWVKEAALYKNELAYEDEKTYTSIYGQEFKTEFQKVDEEFTQCSNGRVYEMKEYYIPRYPYYFDTLFFDTEYVYTWFEEEGNDRKYFDIPADNRFMLENYWIGEIDNGVEKNFGIVERDGVGPLWLEFRSVNKPMATGIYEEVKVMPGTYSLYGNVYGAGEYGPDTTLIYINDMYMGEFPDFKFSVTPNPDQMRLICEDIVVSDTFDMLKIKFVDADDGERDIPDYQSTPKIMPGSFKLLPSTSNY